MAFGATVSFAQTDQDYEGGKLEIERLSNTSNTAETSDKKKIEISELPLQVQEALQRSEYKDWDVAEIYEIQEAAPGWVDEDIPLEEGQTAASLNSDFSYEIVLLSQDTEDEIENSQDTIAEEQEELPVENAAEGTETIQVESPAVILLYDEEGKLLKQQESAPEEIE